MRLLFRDECVCLRLPSQVKIGDILVSVDDVAIKGFPYAGLAALVLGEEGTRATLVLRDHVLGEVPTKTCPSNFFV